MADGHTANLNLTKPEVGASGDSWGTKQNDAFDKIDAVFAPDGTGTPVGLNIGSDNKFSLGGTLAQLAGSAANLLASLFFIKDATDGTKIAQFDASGITTATTRTFKFPDISDTLATQTSVIARTPTGTVLSGYYGATAPAGFVLLCGRTIGSATSGATERANADTQNLFVSQWTIFAGANVLGGAGASAAADWAANKKLALPDHRGVVMAGLDNIGGTNRNYLGPSGIASTTRGATGGSATESASVNVSGTVSVTVSGTLAGSVVSNSGVATWQDGPGGFHDAAAVFSAGALAVSVAGSLGGGGGNSMSGTTAVVTNAQPTIMVDQIIAL